MRTTTRALLAAALAGALVVAGCGDDDDSSSSGAASTATTQAAATADVAFQSDVLSGLPIGYPEPKPADLTVAFLAPLRAAESAAIVADSFEATVKGLGGTPILYDGRMQPAMQISQMEQAIARKVDGIVIFPVDARALDTGIRAAEKAGIPTIAIEYNTSSKDQIGALDSQILQGVDRLAYEQVKGMAAVLPTGGKVVHISLDVPSPIFARMAQQTKLWSEKFGLDYLGDVRAQKDDVSGGEEAATRALSQYPDVQGILAYADATAIGAAAAARSAGKRDIKISGNYGGAPNGLDAIEQGRIVGTVLQNLPDIGKFSAWGIYDKVENPDAPLPKSVTISPPRYIDKSNAADVPRG